MWYNRLRRLYAPLQINGGDYHQAVRYNQAYSDEGFCNPCAALITRKVARRTTTCHNRSNQEITYVRLKSKRRQYINAETLK